MKKIILILSFALTSSAYADEMRSLNKQDLPAFSNQVVGNYSLLEVRNSELYKGVMDCEPSIKVSISKENIVLVSSREIVGERGHIFNKNLFSYNLNQIIEKPDYLKANLINGSYGIHKNLNILDMRYSSKLDVSNDKLGISIFRRRGGFSISTIDSKFCLYEKLE